MRSIKTEIVINAAREDVWAVLMDHNSYNQWNPFIHKISGSTNTGGHLSVTIKNGDKSPMQFKPLVLVNEKEKEFRWVGKLFIKGLFDGEHYFILEKLDTNQTRFIHGENFTGILSGLFMKMIGKDTRAGFESMNNALKQKAENL